MAAREPEVFQRLIDLLVEASATYLIAQLHAGADVVQIFDSWAGVLGPDEFERWSIAPTARIVALVRGAVRSARIIGFPKGVQFGLERYIRETGVDAVGIDWTVPLEVARGRLQPFVAVQGNLDPAVLVAGGEGLDQAIDRILASLAGGPLHLQPRPRHRAGDADRPCRAGDCAREAATMSFAELAASAYPWLKAFHVIAVIAWMAGIFYLPRLFVYHAGSSPARRSRRRSR